jgi:hypothetical protein
MIRREAEDNVDATANDDLAEGEVRIHQRKCVSNNGLSVLQGKFIHIYVPLACFPTLKFSVDYDSWILL